MSDKTTSFQIFLGLPTWPGPLTRPNIMHYGQVACTDPHLSRITSDACINTFVHTWLAEEKFFVRPLLDQWGVQPQTIHREEYKCLPSTLIYKGYTKHHRDAAFGWLSDCMDQIVGDVAEVRGIPRHQVSICIYAFFAHMHSA